ncbi:transcriptional regulator [Kordiimonas sediminis]|uniref:Transcriptional regulator n=1 Tax=Kordiimonas sediminis TaxID=1735581 RepID=A0A919AZN0_9PROT|nr:metalloregulator ArsR/SmtB family transcription factor [Kordiimonas sediminis]GHF31236.1 transcriptional regulator [Kordiimonas sediminis]
MDINTATRSFGALSQETRLHVFRMLIRAGQNGMPAGEIANALGTPHNTMSSHLSILASAGLVTSRREGRSIIYSADYGGTRALLGFLVEDCCQGTPEVCGPLLDNVLASDCCEAE